MGEDAALCDTLVALETARTQAWLRRDPAALAALLDEEFQEINVLGRLSKRQLLEELYPRLQLLSLQAEDYCLVPLGPDAALLTYACAETVRVSGQEISGRFHVAALWRRAAAAGQDPAAWRLLLWQITPLAEAA